jgi:putative acetyltransferase
VGGSRQDRAQSETVRVTVTIRPERQGDEPAIRHVHAEAFRSREAPADEPPEVGLVDGLRRSAAWIPELSMVAVVDDAVVGHVVTTRAHVEGDPALVLGPIGVLPSHQGAGVGSALMEATIEVADHIGEPLIVLLGSTDYYPRFGFVPAAAIGIIAPHPEWGDNLQALPLHAYHPFAGPVRFPPPFDEL